MYSYLVFFSFLFTLFSTLSIDLFGDLKDLA